MTSYRKQMLVGLAAASAAAVSLAACGGGSSGGGSSNSSGGSAGKGGTLNYYTSSSAQTEHTDPQRIYIGRDITNMTRTVYRQLVAFPADKNPDVANKPLPDLATDTGKSSNNAKTWQFTLKDGIKWQDGSPITCEDFKYGASRVFATDLLTGGPNYLLAYLDIPSGKTGPLYTGPYHKGNPGEAAFNKAIVCNGKTITYHFKKPWPDFPLAIAALHMMDPYKKSQDQGAKSNYAIFSNGPYKLKGSWSQQKGGTMVRNPNYDPKTDNPKIRKALPDQINFVIGSTSETINDRLIADSGQDKSAVSDRSVPPAFYSRLQGPVNDRLTTVLSPYVDYLSVNVKRQKNPLVRKAIYMATDQQGWISAGGGKRSYDPAYSIVDPNVHGYQKNPALQSMNRPLGGDPAAAKKLLKQAGVQMPYPITFAYEKTDTADKQAAALQQGWQKAGFKVNLQGIGGTSYYTTIQKPTNNYDLMWAGWGADWPSAITVTPPLFDGRVNISSASSGSDYGLYNNPTFNKYVDQAQSSSNLAEQTKALQNADEQLGKDVAYIPLEVQKFNLLRGDKIGNYMTTASSNGYPDLGPIGVSK